MVPGSGFPWRGRWLYDGNPKDSAYNAYNNDEQAPPSPDGTYVAYVATPTTLPCKW